MYLILAKVVHPPLLVADDLAVLELDHALAHRVDDALVVGGHDHGGAGPVDALEQLHDVLGGGRVQVPGGLVAEHQQGAVDERARDRDPLLLAAGELVGEAVGLVVQADQLEHLGNGTVDRVAPRADHLEGEGDVLADGLIGEELEVLEYAADGTPQRRHLPGGEPVQLLARHPDVPGAGPLLLDQQADEGRLAGAGLADDEDELALADLHRDVVEGDDVVTVDLGDVVECDHGCEQPFALRGSAWLGGWSPHGPSAVGRLYHASSAVTSPNGAGGWRRAGRAGRGRRARRARGR